MTIDNAIAELKKWQAYEEVELQRLLDELPHLAGAARQAHEDALRVAQTRVATVASILAELAMP